MIGLREAQYAEHREITEALRGSDLAKEVDIAARLLVCNLRIASYDEQVQHYQNNINPKTFVDHCGHVLSHILKIYHK